MQDFTTYVAPIQNIKLLEKSAHVDLVKLPDMQEGPIPLKNFEYMDDGSITVTFGGGNSPVYPAITSFAHKQNFQVNQTFAFRCLEKDDSTFLGFYKYLGTTTAFDDEYLLLWHFEGETQKPLPCNYPDVIINSVDVVDIEPEKNYLDRVHRQLGLEKDNSIENDKQPSKPVINPEKDIPVFFEIMLMKQKIEWETPQREWNNPDFKIEPPARICSEILYPNGTNVFLSTILETPYTLSDMEFHEVQPEGCAKVLPVTQHAKT